MDTLAELLPLLRLRLGDTNSASYRYLDEWLLLSLSAAVTALSRYWGNKYLLDSLNEIYRSTDYAYFESDSPPVIQFKDEWIIVLMASIIIKAGSLENMAWDLGSWRDAELSFSNLESGRQKDLSLKRDWEELNNYLKVPKKRPVIPVRTSFVEQ